MKTALPQEPFKSHAEWRKWMDKQTKHAMTPEDKFEANFMKIWATFKQDVINARTKKK